MIDRKSMMAKSMRGPTSKFSRPFERSVERKANAGRWRLYASVDKPLPFNGDQLVSMEGKNSSVIPWIPGELVRQFFAVLFVRLSHLFNKSYSIGFTQDSVFGQNASSLFRLMYSGNGACGADFFVLR
ncbi:MAG: hypothetical protein LBB76_03120 [Azoarcus sp.]|nr:hypothetical protein [Azoarcus sp.]